MQMIKSRDDQYSALIDSLKLMVKEDERKELEELNNPKNKNKYEPWVDKPNVLANAELFQCAPTLLGFKLPCSNFCPCKFACRTLPCCSCGGCCKKKEKKEKKPCCSDAVPIGCNCLCHPDFACIHCSIKVPVYMKACCITMFFGEEEYEDEYSNRGGKGVKSGVKSSSSGGGKNAEDEEGGCIIA